uniref:BPTI/Kunitz inhibitor domain-containing protein n=1 Tax=Leptobrachium leishanense TaxID=445787 RepID=A0A8C5M0M9_9ANUR
MPASERRGNLTGDAYRAPGHKPPAGLVCAAQKPVNHYNSTRQADSECDDLPAARSSGKEAKMRWSYDKSQKVCMVFLQIESGTSRNSFLTEKECLRQCSAEYNHIYPEGEAVCELPVESGPCMALMVMWYYDAKRDVCDNFIYGGCQGNGNRFYTKGNCTRTCVNPKRGRFGGAAESEDSPQSDTDTGLIVGVVCGCVFGVAFLVTLGLYLVQRKKAKTQHKRVPAVEMK